MSESKPRGQAALRTAFLEDHRLLTRGLTETLEALRAEEDGRAMDRAESLDRAVGPHMAFEEAVFYPELARVLGRGYVKELYEEHGTGQRAVARLLEHPREEPIAPAERAELVDDLHEMLDHAVGCGTLLSHLAQLPDDRCDELLHRLLELRDSGVRWTERKTRRGSPEGP